MFAGIFRSSFPVLAGALLFAGLAGCDSDREFKELKETFVPPTPGEVARDAFSLDPDARRRSIATLSGAIFGGEQPYVKLYRLMVSPYGANGEKDATVRAAAVSALGLHGTPDDVPLICDRLTDPKEEPYVKWEAAKALQKLHNPIAIGPLIAGVKDDQEDVRMASAYALGQYPDPRVFDELMFLLDDQNFGVVGYANLSLQTLTGQDIEADGVEWLRFQKAHPNNLFEKQRPYKWQPFNKPPGFFRKMKFWDPVKPKGPELPKGMEPAATQPTTKPATQPATDGKGQPFFIGK
jgi:hypothetical protein